MEDGRYGNYDRRRDNGGGDSSSLLKILWATVGVLGGIAGIFIWAWVGNVNDQLGEGRVLISRVAVIESTLKGMEESLARIASDLRDERARREEDARERERERDRR